MKWLGCVNENVVKFPARFFDWLQLGCDKVRNVVLYSVRSFFTKFIVDNIWNFVDEFQKFPQFLRFFF